MHVNPTGRFVTGGPMGDAGLTGRKIIVDSYGGMARHGGGAFSGKDPTKVDRSAAYAARWVAKNVVAAGLADRFEVEVAYGIGIARPISFSVDSFGTGRIHDAEIQALIERHFDLRPASIIAALDLRRRSTARRPRTAISGGLTSTCRGSGPTRRRSSRPRQGCPNRSPPRRSSGPPRTRSPAARAVRPRGARPDCTARRLPP